jgi:uncharacterized protein (DUF2141 family)
LQIGLAAILVGVLPTFPALPTPVHIQAAPAASTSWLDELNTWRASTGVSALTENTTWSQGDYLHAQYMVKNDLVTHYETPGVPYYSTAGDAAAQASNIYVSSSTSTSDQQAIDWWMQAPFHAMGLMDPRLTQSGFGSYREVKSGWEMGAAVDVIRGNSFAGGNYPVYFPGNGTAEPLTSYGGGEFPDPLQACPGYSVPTGLPVFIQVGGNVNTTVGSVHSFTGNGVPLNHCVIDSSNSSVGSYLYTRGGVILVPQSPLQSGVKYAVALTVNNVPYTWSFTVGPFNACTSVNVSAAPPSPALMGTSVTLTASATCPDPSPLYHFNLLAPGASAYQLARDYSTNPTYVWNTTGLAPGTYRFSVWAKDANSSGAFGNSAGRWDAYNNDTLYTLGGCSVVTVSTSPPSPSGVGTSVTLTAAASGCPDPNPLYHFGVLAPGATTYQLAQDYSTSRTYTWNTAGLALGTYRFSVWAKDANSSGAFGNSAGRWDAYNNDTLYTLGGCSAVRVSSSPLSTAEVGGTVVLTATASGCPDPNPLYHFGVLAPGATTYQLAQDYSTSPTLAWNTAGLAPGTYRFSVWAKDANSSGAFGNSVGRWDAYNNDTLFTLGGCSAVSVSTSPLLTAEVGGNVTLTATASGCTHPLYHFGVLAPGATTYQVAQDYSTSPTLSWNTTGLIPGTYRFSVWAKDAGSGGASGNSGGRWDAYNNDTLYTLSTCTVVSVTVSPGSPSARGTTVTVTATASGCSNPVYHFGLLAPGGTTYVLAQDYSASGTYTWNTTGLAPGTYRFSVWARDAGSSGAYNNSAGAWDVYDNSLTFTIS